MNVHDCGQGVAWTTADSKAANAEGWDVFDALGSANGRFQVCRIDDPEAWARRGDTPAVSLLAGDEAAWLLVLSGSAAHHAKAREFIGAHNPLEWESMAKFAGGRVPFARQAGALLSDYQPKEECR